MKVVIVMNVKTPQTGKVANATRPNARWRVHAQRILSDLIQMNNPKERPMSNKYTPEDLDARLRFVIGCVLGAVLFTTTLAILYALVFVSQPIGAQAENDKMFFSVLSSIATFITGTLAGLMISNVKGKQAQEEEADIPVEE
jgi:hypothetical protein